MNRQYEPPTDWQEFERMCLAGFRALWRDPSTMLHGRPGQPQDGVDIYGRPNQCQEWAGVQCKLQWRLAGRKLTPQDIIAEVESAKNFKPKLSCYYIATTSPRDVGLQKTAREITDTHLQTGLFSVTIYSWEDIIDILTQTGTLGRFFPEVDHAEIKNELGRVSGLLESHMQVDALLVSQTAIRVSEIESMVLASEYSGEIDFTKQLLEEGKPTEALRHLQVTKKRIWTKALPTERFRLLTNMGAAHLALGNEQEAATLFLEALQYNQDDEKAMCNGALGYFIISKHDESRRLIEQVLARNLANARAYSLQIHLVEDGDLTTAVASIPEGLLDSCEIAYALGHAYMKRDNPTEARPWFERALRSSTPSNAAQVLSHLGACIIEEQRSKHPGCSAHAGLETREEVSKGVAFLTQALESAKGTQSTPDVANWLHNRAVGKRILGDFEGALQDILEALRLDPDNVHWIKDAAILYMAGDRYAEAAPLLERIKGDPSVPEVSLLLAHSYRSQQAYDSANRVIEAIFGDCHREEILREANRLKIRTLADQGKTREAVRLAEDLVNKCATVPNLVEAARAYRADNRPEQAMEYATRGQSLLREDSSFWDILSVADELYLLQETDSAVPLYERIIDPTSDSPFTRRMVDALVRSDQLGKALAIARSVRDTTDRAAFYYEVEAGILEEIGDLPAARVVCQKYLSEHPDDASMIVRLAVIEYRASNIQEVDRLVSTPIEVSTLSLHDSTQLAKLFNLRSRWRESLDVIYEARRRFYDEGEVHAAYIFLFLPVDKNECPWLEPTSVEIGSAVCVQDVAGNRAWWLIENRPDLSSHIGEISPAHPLAVKLLGKTVGDRVPHKENSLVPETLEIVELRSKYVHAFRESTDKLETLFPGLAGFTSIHIGDPKPDNTPTEGMARFLEMVMLDGEQTKEIAGLYRRGVLTINQLATMLNRDVIDVFRGLTSSPDLGVYCAPPDNKIALAVSEALTRSTRLMADVTAVLTLHWLGVGKAVTEAFGRIAVTQSTVDLLHQNLEGYRFAREGFGLIGVTDGRFTFTQVSAEEVSRISEEVGAVLKWLTESAEILPCNLRLALRRGQRHELAQALGRSFADTALVAAERGYVLFSDDFRFRWYANRMFGVRGVWSQAVLHRCAMMKHLTIEAFSKAVVDLVRRNYRYTWVLCDELVESARQCDWGIEEPFLSTVKVLKDYTVPSACGVAAAFLKSLYAEPVLRPRSFIIQAVLDYLTSNREPEIILRTLEDEVREQFVLMPGPREEVIQTIRDWRRIRISPLKTR